MVLRRWGVLALLSLVAAARPAGATGVPIDGFLPLVGISLTREYVDDFTFAPVPSTTMAGPQLGAGGVAHYDVALMDTGAAVSIINATSRPLFGIDDDYPGPGGNDGFTGGNTITIGGATGFVEGDTLDPLGLYASGLQMPPRTSSSGPLQVNSSGMLGQTNSSIVAVPEESDLPNVLGLSYLSQYATRIRSDQPQLFSLNGQTVRTPSIEFLPRGSGGMGITRKAPLSLNGQSPVTPQHIPTLDPDLILDTPWEDPFAPTVVFGGLFLNVDVEDDAVGEGGELDNYQFFFDTGASVTVVSEFNAFQLGFDVTTDDPEFTLAIVGSGGTKLDVPGFFVDKFTIPALGGSIVVTNVPVIVLDIADPSDPNNIIDGFVGTNLLAGRNLVVDPNPATAGSPSAGLYISDSVTTDIPWIAAAASADWNAGSSWTGGVAPTKLSIANVRNVGGGTRTANLSSHSTVWEVNVSGLAEAPMNVVVNSGATLTTFSGLNIESHGVVRLAGGSLDVQYVDIRSGRLTGTGTIATGSGPIPGQVENFGVVAPASAANGIGIGVLTIEGRYASGAGSTLEIEVTGFDLADRLIVDGSATLGGTLRVLTPGSTPYLPPTNAEYSIVTASEGIGGTFDALELAPLPDNWMWHVTYEEQAVVLRVTLAGDFDRNYRVDDDDLIAWRNGNGMTYSAADFLMWQRNYGAMLVATPVPEPGTVALMAIGAWELTRRARRKRRG